MYDVVSSRKSEEWVEAKDTNFKSFTNNHVSTMSEIKLLVTYKAKPVTPPRGKMLSHEKRNTAKSSTFDWRRLPKTT